MDYRSAGVDVAAGRAFVEQIRPLVQRTQRPEVVGRLGGFAGLCQIPRGYRQPLLVSGTDGVGTKLKLAQALNRHETVGIDLVAMCVNDVLTCGAEPLFFLDYIACGRLAPEMMTAVVAGIAQGCEAAGCALLGGETAEMPGFYAEGVYDLAGFCVGVVEQDQVLDGTQVQVGDVVLGLASSGLHSNGFSLVRKIVSDRQLSWQDTPFGTTSLGELCLEPTRLYVQPIRAALGQGIPIHGMAHITGGGLPENLPRCLGEGRSAQLDPQAWPIPPLFHWLGEMGEVSLGELFNTFNMGIGYTVVLPASAVAAAQACFAEWGIDSWPIGTVVAGSGEVLGLPAA
ncbi:phosphoribosylformylglycinamidine cyclo-ligase [Thermosynechococcus sichuanensis E542]|uniref:Phosphoribosylformylglycinamidine cyclo-ligase n=1 Tax=Thermosynechococcus sichuanensis E542 TaxID=2016101 RepID=A0A3B7MFL5_9CYAN|nr:phosphoribosylformylglycinamidine cyclo-ligase [Thermosynechococcus vestitus]AXY68365.1 phosphoribosylformylglycinamidine cyclo-ligase [Thermosynechococcus vestitus E542]